MRPILARVKSPAAVIAALQWPMGTEDKQDRPRERQRKQIADRCRINHFPSPFVFGFRFIHDLDIKRIDFQADFVTRFIVLRRLDQPFNIPGLNGDAL